MSTQEQSHINVPPPIRQIILIVVLVVGCPAGIFLLVGAFQMHVRRRLWPVESDSSEKIQENWKSRYFYDDEKPLSPKPGQSELTETQVEYLDKVMEHFRLDPNMTIEDKRQLFDLLHLHSLIEGPLFPFDDTHMPTPYPKPSHTLTTVLDFLGRDTTSYKEPTAPKKAVLRDEFYHRFHPSESPFKFASLLPRKPAPDRLSSRVFFRPNSPDATMVEEYSSSGKQSIHCLEDAINESLSMERSWETLRHASMDVCIIPSSTPPTPMFIFDDYDNIEFGSQSICSSPCFETDFKRTPTPNTSSPRPLTSRWSADSEEHVRLRHSKSSLSTLLKLREKSISWAFSRNSQVSDIVELPVVKEKVETNWRKTKRLSRTDKENDMKLDV